MVRLWTYIKDVESGRVPGCIHVRNAVRRFKADYKRTDLEFRKDKVKQVVDFIGHLKHFTGAHSGKNFKLMPWQLFIIANLYGFYWRGSNQRRFQTAYIEVARKNGKTALSAAL